MRLCSLQLYDFKNYEDARIAFDEGFNIIYGQNAAGKTNVLEAIFFFAAGKSFRGSRDRDLIRFGCEGAGAQIRFASGGLERGMELQLSRAKKRQISVGGAPVTRLSEYLGLFRAVIFTPDHLNLIKGAPEFRRRFLDLAICQSFPRYAASLNEYNRVLAQKNALLKRAESLPAELLAVYNERIAALAAVITLNRKKYLAHLEEAAAPTQAEISGGTEALSLAYSSQAGEELGTQQEVRARYEALLAAKTENELRRGVALYGPHKDDFAVCINQRNARVYASQGQQRSAVLSLKLAEGELSMRLTGEYPVFLLDDILSELDAARKAYILDPRQAGHHHRLRGGAF